MSKIAVRRLPPLATMLAILAAASLPLFMQTAGAAAIGAATTSKLAALPVSTQPDSASQIELTPEDRGNLLLAQRHYRAAIDTYKKIPEKSADVWNKMGIAYQQLLEPYEAMHCFLVSLKVDPKNGNVLNNLGTIFVSLKNYRAAQSCYKKALKLDPNSAVLFKNYGTELMLRRKYKRGGQMYARAAALDPLIFEGQSGFSVANPTSNEDRGAMNYYLAVACARAGIKGPAIDYLRKALNEGYTDPKKIVANDQFASLRGIPAFEQLLAQ